MEYHPDLENLDEDGYTQLDFSSRRVPRRPVFSEKGYCGKSHWRSIAVTLGILCLIILVIAVVLGATGVLSSSCPPNWVIHENGCYLFSTPLDTWEGSKTQCSQQGASLLKIDSSNELTFIKKQSSFKSADSFWIGLSRQQTKGPWLWEDGSMFSSNLFQIRSTATQETTPHNCVWIHDSIIYDQPCSVYSFSICEKKLLK
nr:PREDICTED: C-type lectin domain family 7 member A isoform X2 [Rhinolophus sinicus]